MSEAASKTKTPSWSPTTAHKSDSHHASRPFLVPVQHQPQVPASQDLSGYRQPQSGDMIDNVRRYQQINTSSGPNEPTATKNWLRLLSTPQTTGLTIQSKLTIREPGDSYEQEADKVASEVRQRLDAESSSSSTRKSGKRLQFQAPPNTTPWSQPAAMGEHKLWQQIPRQENQLVGQAISKFPILPSQEKPNKELQAKPSISDLQMSPLFSAVQREAMSEEEELQAKSILQGGIAAGEASTDLESAINSARGSGQPLDAGLQESMGRAMGADFSGVKVHTDAQSDQLNRSIQANVNINHDEGLEKGANVTEKNPALTKEASPDERKEAAKNKFISLMEVKKSMSREEIEGVLVNLKIEFQLSDVKLEGDQFNPKIGFYASPATFLPITLIPLAAGAIGAPAPANPISGQKAGVGAAASVIAGDYIKATSYDGPFLTPGKQVVTAFNTRFTGQRTTHNNGNHSVMKIKDPAGIAWIYLYPVKAINQAALPLHTTTNANNYRRAGTVEAKSSVPRGKGRSGKGETVFGHFGADEERILTGQSNTNYNGGHLVGDQIMDSHRAFNLYEDWNLAPQQRSFNSPVYTGTIENAVTKAITAGATIKYTVTVQYPDDTYQIKPSVLIKNLFPAVAGYRKEIEGAIKHSAALDAPFTLTRRTPGFWQATAEVVGGGKTINSGKINVRQNVAFENNPVNVQPGVNYQPGALEQVRYSLEKDIGAGAGFQALKGPTPKNPLVYAGATQVRATARQQTF